MKALGGNVATSQLRRTGSRVLSAPRASSTSTTERARVLRSSNRFWHPDELSGAPSTIQHLLADLVRDGELRHIRKGLYWRGSRTPLGMSPPPVEALVRELAPGRGIGPAGLSAANVLHLSTQIPRRAEIALPIRPPSDVAAVKFVSRAARTARRTAKLASIEVAFLESLEAWEKVLEVPTEEAWRILKGLVTSGAVRADRLARAARTEPAPVRARLYAMLKDSGAEDLAARIRSVDARTTRAAMRHIRADAG